MNKFKRNYKKKDYEKQFSSINQEYKSKNTLRDILLRKLKTSEEYEDSIEKIQNSSYIPPGLELYENKNTDLILDSYDQTLKIGNGQTSIIELDKITNYRFYINTPYFDRNGSDPYLLFKLDDPRISSISELVLSNLKILGVNDYDLNLLNIIVRIYRPGDILNFHTDREIFGENIYGFVLYNLDSSRGLVLKNKSNSYMLEEKQGMIWKLSNEARWEFSHGYCSNFNLDEQFVRISISFRFFNNLKQIPKKDFEKL